MQDRFSLNLFRFIFGILCVLLFVDFYLIILFSVIAFSLLFFNFDSKNNWGIIFSIFIFIFLGIFRFNMVDVSASSV